MRGASAESAATVTDALAAAIDGGADANRVADDLFGVSDVLRREASLRRTVTDTTLNAEARSGLVRTIFGERLDPASTDVLATAVERRWTVSRDLGDTLEDLGVVAVVRGADQVGEGDRLEDELFGFGQTVADNPSLRDALSDPVRSQEDKRSLLEGLLADRVTPGTLRLARQAITGSHRTVALAIEDYQKLAAAHRDRLVATATVAQQLDEAETGRLASALAGQYGRAVHVNVVVDPEVIGGVRVVIGDDVIDGTVSNRLDEARRRLAG